MFDIFSHLSSLFTMDGILSLLYRLPAILIALSFHEAAHAFAAYKMGDPTARNLGRMTLNPFAHIDPLGFVALLLFRFGWAKPVPVNPRNYTDYKKGEIVVSLAGVTLNLLLSFFSYGIFMACIAAGVTNVAVMEILSNFVFINIALLIFNLIPVPPLDGYHVFRVLLARVLSYRVFDFLERYGTYILLFLLFSGAVSELMGTLVYAILSGFQGVWSPIFGLFF